MYELATGTYGMAAEDIFFDPLVLPISTGMDADRRSALETIEGVRRIAAALPQCQIICGVSNVSFGLKPQARVVLNSAFLHELQAAGLTAAILHAAKIQPQSRTPEAQWQAALDLIYDRRRAGFDPLQHFIGLFPAEGPPAGPAAAPAAALSLEERLQRHIIDGEKRHLIETLEEARAKYPPLDIINNHLLSGMKVVGELFGSGQMQLPFVLQSAEVMKMAVAHLQQYMAKAQGTTRGSLVLATVKGDVHDIGKNLVDIILTNNGFTVHNLGIKQPISHIIEQWRAHKADAIGLSGLLVKSVTVMKEGLEELRGQGITVPVLLGGAALSRHYCEAELRPGYGGKVYYGHDAFEGLRLMDMIATGRGPELDGEIEERLAKRRATEQTIAAGRSAAVAAVAAGAGGAAAAEEAAAGAPADEQTIDIPPAPFWGSRVVEQIDPDQVYPYINRVALFRGQWQFRKGRLADAEYEEQVKREIEPIFERLKRQGREQQVLRFQVVYGYFPCNRDGDDLVVFDAREQTREVERFHFPRQATRGRQCLSDFFLPLSAGVRDVLGAQCVTAGSEVSRRAHELFEGHQYQEYLYLHGLGVESAEGLAEMWHKRMRQELGIGAADSPHTRELFTQHYRGSRYSFGYPACPDLSDQEKLFRLLHPERIGCTLTENWQIEPEQSTSAIIVHHPRAKYFSV
jgi:5-methyltetrahydrofolate--homocysteine methyltransferase